MSSTFQFRFRKGTWGLWVEVTAEAKPLSTASGSAIRINPQLWLQLQVPYIDQEDLHFLVWGMKLVENEIGAHKKTDGPVLVNVLDIKFTPTDYQPEALACGIVGWAAKEFGFTVPEIPIAFDEQRNRYVVHLPPPNRTVR